MAQIKHLAAQADYYYFSAVAAYDEQSRKYFDSVVSHIASYAKSGLASVHNLLANPKHRKSQGLQALRSQFPILSNFCQTADVSSALGFIDNAEGVIGNMLFFTSKGNVGTGTDNATTLKEGGYTPPAWYVSNISSMLGELKTHFSENPADQPISVV
jgi:hypothetical protein